MPKLVALKEHSYGSTLRKPGDVYEATDRHARLLKAVKKADDAPAESAMKAGVPDPVPVEEPPAPAVPRRGRYARRDMRARDEAE